MKNSTAALVHSSRPSCAALRPRFWSTTPAKTANAGNATGASPCTRLRACSSNTEYWLWMPSINCSVAARAFNELDSYVLRNQLLCPRQLRNHNTSQ